jgi:hypothetical protein
MIKLFEIETDNSEILAKFRELARKHKVKFREWNLAREEHPSPSKDPYFDNPKNVASIMKGVNEMESGKVVKLSDKDIQELLGL